jgi:kinetochore protein Mis13/DSN1
LDPTLPDALRLRHLLVWCANRNLPTSSKSTGAPNLPPLTNAQRERLKVIQQEFIKSLASGKIETAVGSSVHEKTNGTQIEHEQNTKNKQRLENFLRDINEYVPLVIQVISIDKV